MTNKLVGNLEEYEVYQVIIHKPLDVDLQHDLLLCRFEERFPSGGDDNANVYQVASCTGLWELNKICVGDILMQKDRCEPTGASSSLTKVGGYDWCPIGPRQLERRLTKARGQTSFTLYVARKAHGANAMSDSKPASPLTAAGVPVASAMSPRDVSNAADPSDRRAINAVDWDGSASFGCAGGDSGSAVTVSRDEEDAATAMAAMSSTTCGPTMKRMREESVHGDIERSIKIAGTSLNCSDDARRPSKLGCLSVPTETMQTLQRQCIPMKPPIPCKFQGDMEKFKSVSVPDFSCLANFQAVTIPQTDHAGGGGGNNMRRCVMCGVSCPTRNKRTNKGDDEVPLLAPKNKSGPEHFIPWQNKGLCTLCDVNVWVVVDGGLEIKWCKGCKNFRPWAAFGDKGLTTKCMPCRVGIRDKYAMQKEKKTTTTSSGPLLKGKKAISPSTSASSSICGDGTGDKFAKQEKKKATVSSINAEGSRETNEMQHARKASSVGGEDMCAKHVIPQAVHGGGGRECQCPTCSRCTLRASTSVPGKEGGGVNCIEQEKKHAGGMLMRDASFTSTCVIRPCAHGVVTPMDTDEVQREVPVVLVGNDVRSATSESVASATPTHAAKSTTKKSARKAGNRAATTTGAKACARGTNDESIAALANGGTSIETTATSTAPTGEVVDIRLLENDGTTTWQQTAEVDAIHDDLLKAGLARNDTARRSRALLQKTICSLKSDHRVRVNALRQLLLPHSLLPPNEVQDVGQTDPPLPSLVPTIPLLRAEGETNGRAQLWAFLITLESQTKELQDENETLGTRVAGLHASLADLTKLCDAWKADMGSMMSRLKEIEEKAYTYMHS